MQIITMYLRADSVNARLVDSYNQLTACADARNARGADSKTP